MSIETKILNRLHHLDEGSKLTILHITDAMLAEKGMQPVKDVFGLTDIKEAVLPFCSQYPIKWLGLFGSYARGEADEESDIDLVIEFERNISLMKVLGLKVRLEEVLRRTVDLVQFNQVDADIKEAIEKDKVVLYEKK